MTKIEALLRFFFPCFFSPAANPETQQDQDHQNPASTPPEGMTVGTIFGHPRGHAWFCTQDHRLSAEPTLLIEMSVPTHELVEEMKAGLDRITLACDSCELSSLPLGLIPIWTMYCNGRRVGFAMRRRANEETHLTLKEMELISTGTGATGSSDSGEVMYVRANCEHGAKDPNSESYRLIDLDGCPGRELVVVFLLRSREDPVERPSADFMTRIRSLRQYAFVMKELVNKQIEKGKQLEAVSIQLVILATLKQALYISLAQESDREGSSKQKNANELEDFHSEIESEFIREVQYAEELQKFIELVPADTVMPDATEAIFQFALALARRGVRYELIDRMEAAAHSYSKAVKVLIFLLEEAPLLSLSTPFTPTDSIKHRLRTYINILSNRQDYTKPQLTFVLNSDQDSEPTL